MKVCVRLVAVCRVVIEKPVGHDLASAAALIQALGVSFAHNEVLFVDHYLGKYGLQLMREFPTLAHLVPAASIVRGATHCPLLKWCHRHSILVLQGTSSVTAPPALVAPPVSSLLSLRMCLFAWA